MGLVVRTTHTNARHMRARSSATALGARTRAEAVRPNPYNDCTPYHHQSTQRGNAFTSVHSAHAKPQRFTAPLPGTQHPPWEVTSLIGHAAVRSGRAPLARSLLPRTYGYHTQASA